MTWRLTKQDICPTCDGLGGHYMKSPHRGMPQPDIFTSCPECNGKGHTGETELEGDELIETLLDRIEALEEQLNTLTNLTTTETQ